MTALYSRLIRNRQLLGCCLESFFNLALAKLQLSYLPYANWRFKKCYFQCETIKSATRGQIREAHKIGRAIRVAARYVPWRSQCLDQAISAQRMLSYRGLDSTLYLGMLKSQEAKWTAHAWVRCGNEWVIGYDPKTPYTVVGTYARILHEHT